MPDQPVDLPAGPIYRIDKFAVPAAARDAFLAAVAETHAVLRRQPGFRGDRVVEQCGGPGRFNFVTLVEWAGAEAIEAAAAAVRQRHAALGLDPRALIEAAGIEADLALYRAVALPLPAPQIPA